MTIWADDELGQAAIVPSIVAPDPRAPTLQLVPRLEERT